MVGLDKVLAWILSFREERREMEEAPFYGARLSAWLPRRALALSVVLHVLAVVLPLPAFLFAPPPQEPASALRIEYDVQWTQSRRLPLIAPKRERRRCLLELGLSPYVAALVMLKVLGAHAVPVDQTLVDCLEMKIHHMDLWSVI